MTPAILLDTDVVSFLLKRDSRAEWYLPYLEGRILVVSFMTVAELDRWALAWGWGEARRAALDRHLHQFLIHPFDRGLCTQWAAVCEMARKKGRPISCADAWIAATALHHGIPLLTHNGHDYQGLDGVQIISAPTRP